MSFYKRVSVTAFACVLSAPPLVALERMGETQIVQVAAFQLAPDADRQFQRFKRLNSGFASFYASKDGTAVGWNFGRCRQADADKHAKTICEARSPAGCVPYTRVLPTTSVNKTALPEVHLRSFNALKRSARSGQFGAMAINRSGGIGTTAKEVLATAESASYVAIKFCDRASNSTRKQLPPDLRLASEREDLFACRVVYQFKKQ